MTSKENTLFGFTVGKMPETCNYCEKKAQYILEAYIFGRKVRFLCEQHKLLWFRNELNV